MANFNESAYLAANPDVAAAVKSGAYTSGWQHWVSNGQAELRLLAPTDSHYSTFNEAAYLAANKDVAAAVNAGTYATAWQHYINNGLAEGRQFATAPAGYNEAAYLDANPDVAKIVHTGSAVYTSGLAHYLLNGINEPTRLTNMTTLQANSAYQAFVAAGGDAGYLAANTDVAAAVKLGTVRTGWEHDQGHATVENRLVAPLHYDMTNSASVEAAGTTNVYGWNETVNFDAGNYDYTLSHFSAGDKVNLPDAFFNTKTLTNASGSDGVVVVNSTDASTGNIIHVTLTGIDPALDATIFNMTSANAAFNTGWIL